MGNDDWWSDDWVVQLLIVEEIFIYWKTLKVVLSKWYIVPRRYLQKIIRRNSDFNIMYIRNHTTIVEEIFINWKSLKIKMIHCS